MIAGIPWFCGGIILLYALWLFVTVLKYGVVEDAQTGTWSTVERKALIKSLVATLVTVIILSLSGAALELLVGYPMMLMGGIVTLVIYISKGVKEQVLGQPTWIDEVFYKGKGWLFMTVIVLWLMASIALAWLQITDEKVRFLLDMLMALPLFGLITWLQNEKL